MQGFVPSAIHERVFIDEVAPALDTERAPGFIRASTGPTLGGSHKAICIPHVRVNGNLGHWNAFLSRIFLSDIVPAEFAEHPSHPYRMVSAAPAEIRPIWRE